MVAVVTGMRAVAVVVMAIVVTGMQVVTMTAVINSVIVVTAVVSRRVRGMTGGVCCMMTMSVPAALERGHHRRRHTVVAQLEQQPAAGRGRHVSGRNQRTHRNPGKQDRQTNPGCQWWIAHWEIWTAGATFAHRNTKTDAGHWVFTATAAPGHTGVLNTLCF